jgi:tight adherence protein B
VLVPITILIFLATLCLALVIYLRVAEQQQSPRTQLKRRLRQMARQGMHELPVEARSEIIRELSPADRFLTGLPLLRGMDRRLDRAGITLSVAACCGSATGIALLAALLAVLATRSGLCALPAAAAALAGCFSFLRIRTRQREEKFTELFPEALTMIARSLRAGHSLNTAVQLVGTEIADPVGELFKSAYDQQTLGLRITDGLTALNDRLESLDLRFFTTVMAINSEIGGNLSEVLEKLAETIRERLRIRRQVRVYTAQGRMSAFVLGALPIFTFVVFNILNPQYESALLQERLGITILVAAACLQLVGFLVIRSIVRIRI